MNGVRGTAGIAAIAICGLSAAPAVWAQQQAAAGWMPSVRVGVTHTDNVNLNDVESIDQTIYRVEPGLRYNKVTDRAELNLAYNLQVLRYGELSQTETFDQYNAGLRLKGWDNRLYVNMGVDSRQTQVNPTQGIPIGNVPLSENRQDRNEYFIEPGVNLDLGRGIALRSSVRQGLVEFSGDGVNSDQRSASFELDNIGAGIGGTWAFRYNWRRAEFDDIGDFENQTAMLELGYWLNPRSRLFASYGLESAWDEPLEPGLEDTRWEAGFEAGVAERYRVEVAAGERSFGNSGRLAITRTFSTGSTTLRYTETPVAENQEIFANPLIAGTLAPENLLARPDQPERFVANRLEWALNLATPRTTAGLTVFRGERTDRTTLAGVPLSDDEQLGIRANVERSVGNKTTLGLRYFIADRELREGGNSEILSTVFTVGYRLGPRTVLSFEYQYANEDADSANLAIRNYTANTVSLFFQRNFF